MLKRGVLANLAVASFAHLVLVIRHGLKQDGLRGEVPLVRAFPAQPSSEPGGHLLMHRALQ